MSSTDILTMNQLMAESGYSRDVIAKLIREGKLAHRRIGRGPITIERADWVRCQRRYLSEAIEPTGKVLSHLMHVSFMSRF